MPLYEYRCASGHVTEKLRRYLERDRPVVCPECDMEARRIPSAHHRQPDGIYSYAPNLGDPNRFERQQQAIRDRKRTIDGDTGE